MSADTSSGAAAPRFTAHERKMQELQEELLAKIWKEEEEKLHALKSSHAFTRPAVPLARVKKIMKLDEDVHMISEQSPRFLAKAVEVSGSLSWNREERL